MRKLLSFLLILCGMFNACQKQSSAPKISETDPNYEKAKTFLNLNKDSSFFYFNLVATAARDSVQTGIAYYYMARIESEAGDYFGAQESLTSALPFLAVQTEKAREVLSSAYNELGLINLDLRNYDAAIEHFGHVQFFRDADERLVLLNNKALAFQKKGAYRQALTLYREIIRKAKSPVTFARILTNKTFTEWLADPRYRAAPDLLKALTIRQREEDSWGQNSSYAHLADYYLASRPDSAFMYAGKMYAIAQRLKSPDDELEALGKLIKVGPVNAAKQYFTRYQLLSDSLQAARNAAKNQFAFIRYEVEKNKADNLKLQQDNTEKKYQLLRQKIFLYLAVALLIATLVWYRKRKQRLELEKQEAIRSSQLKTSKKVHDVVANGLYRIMTELDHQTELDRTRLADKIEDLYEKSRDISYDKEPLSSEAFNDKLTELLSSFANDQIKVAIVGNSQSIWENVSPPAQYDIEHILQELMVNMMKHSQATSAAIRFEREGDKIDIYYTDNGIGIKGPMSYKNGLTNTGNRINSLQGTITFDTNVQQGLKIHLTFPVA